MSTDLVDLNISWSLNGDLRDIVYSKESNKFFIDGNNTDLAYVKPKKKKRKKNVKRQRILSQNYKKTKRIVKILNDLFNAGYEGFLHLVYPSGKKTTHFSKEYDEKKLVDYNLVNRMTNNIAIKKNVRKRDSLNKNNLTKDHQSYLAKLTKGPGNNGLDNF